MRAGTLRKRVTLQMPVMTADALGQTLSPNSTWTTVGTYWGEIRGLTGRESLNDQPPNPPGGRPIVTKCGSRR